MIRLKRWPQVACLLCLALIPATVAAAAVADISDTRRLIFVADRLDPVIDVIDPRQHDRIHRLQAPSQVRRMVITPNAPLLLYSSPDQALLYTYNLQQRQWLTPLELPFVPDNLVLDPGGSKIGITNTTTGGFVLVSAYRQEIMLYLSEVPASGPVLFDPNDIDIYYSADASGSLGLIDTNLRRHAEIPLTEGPVDLSAPSRSLDGRYLYVTDHSNGLVYNLNAFTRVVHKTFVAGQSPIRPYTTPAGLFLYVIDSAKGHWTAYDQNRFAAYTEAEFSPGMDLVAVGGLDRMNLFASTARNDYSLYDNANRRISGEGSFAGLPLQMLGSVDGKTAYIIFSDLAKLAVLDFENSDVQYIDATNNGAAALGMGLSNNVCH